jgi:hypothetical protein
MKRYFAIATIPKVSYFYSLILLFIFAVSPLPAGAASQSWLWEAGTCGTGSGELSDQVIDIEPGSEVCVTPPSYLFTQPSGPTLRWYVGVTIDGQLWHS